jgi:flavin-binding protein dodecin
MLEGETGTSRAGAGLRLALRSKIGRENAMSNVYAVSEVVGTSDKSIEDAIDQAVAVAGQSIRNLDWFQVSELRGHIKDGRVAHYQIALKLGFRYEAKGN